MTDDIRSVVNTVGSTSVESQIAIVWNRLNSLSDRVKELGNYQNDLREKSNEMFNDLYDKLDKVSYRVAVLETSSLPIMANPSTDSQWGVVEPTGHGMPASPPSPILKGIVSGDAASGYRSAEEVGALMLLDRIVVQVAALHNVLSSASISAKQESSLPVDTSQPVGLQSLSVECCCKSATGDSIGHSHVNQRNEEVIPIWEIGDRFTCRWCHVHGQYATQMKGWYVK